VKARAVNSRGRRVRAVDWRDDRGQFAGIEAIPFGILVFVVGSLLVANAWAVIDAKLAVSSAAREAARTYVEAPPDTDTATGAAHAAAVDALQGHGRNPANATIGVSNPAGAMRRCVRVTASVTYRLPAVTLPIIGGYGRGFSVTSNHSEIIDPWRDDLPGSGCG
jgi:hypothetical protein